MPGTAARLQALDPLSVDPAALEVAVQLPAGMNVLPGTAVITITASHGADRLAEELQLAPRSAAGVAMPEGGRVAAFGLGPAEVARMRELQAQVAQWKAGGAAEASFGIGLGGCKLGGGPAPDAEGAILIRLEGAGEFVPLIQPTQVAALVGETALAAMPPCEVRQ
ncbi:hypothetical protein [Gemmobacter aquatilis]|uniref:hypothetical protein n=1 Tax=Gemmobacter aquatilis TaxID=933059 RepID=UPI001113C93B|nr:hypothetical protein [Gemmobacter aquatilis]